jgi:hypothetical protein
MLAAAVILLAVKATTFIHLTCLPFQPTCLACVSIEVVVFQANTTFKKHICGGGFTGFTRRGVVGWVI